MTKKIKAIKSFSLFVVFLLFIWGCSNMMAPYDQYAYSQTVSARVDMLNLIDKSKDTYSVHAQEAETVYLEVMKVREYEKNRIKNTISFNMWNRMIDSTGKNGIIGRFFTEWKAGPRDTTYINEKKKTVAAGFDLITKLESAKLKTSYSSK